MQTQTPVRELRVNPYRPLLTDADAAPLHVGDVVTVLFSQNAPTAPDRRGTVVKVYPHGHYRVEVLADDGEAETFAAPRDLLKLVRRGDA